MIAPPDAWGDPLLASCRTPHPPRPWASVMDAWLAEECGAAAPGELPGALRRIQADLLRGLVVRMCESNAAHRRRLAGLPLPESPEDTARLPFMTPADLAAWERWLCVPQGDVARMVTLMTSGSTGAPKRLAFTEADMERTVRFYQAGLRPHVRAGGILLTLLPGGDRPFGVADLLRRAMRPLDVDVRFDPLAAGPPEALADAATAGDLFRRVRPTCLVAAPRQISALLDALPDGPPPDLAALISGSDFCPEELRRRAERRWGLNPLVHYGLTETAFSGGVECPARDGHHFRWADILVEIVDPLDGAILPMGEIGEIVLTTLRHEALPLLRYRTGDAGSLLPPPCACGSPLPRLGPVLGRIRRQGGGWSVEHPRKGAGEARMPGASFADASSPS